MGTRRGGVWAQSGAIFRIKILEQQFSFLHWKGDCHNIHIIDDWNFEYLEATITFQMRGNLVNIIFDNRVIKSRQLDVQHRSAVDNYTEACLSQMRH